MGRADAGSSKAIGNAIKAKGLGRLRWYCQICEKQCRDENGFQAHTRSEPHMRKMLLVGPKAGQTIAEFSRQFQTEFVTLLRTRHQTNRVRANAVYNEYIQDKHHVHMNATRWVTLNGFIMTIGKAGLVKVDEDEKGLWITWVDTSPKTLQKQAALQKKERATMDGEERERAELDAQIARAKALADEEKAGEEGLQKKEGEKITLNLFGSGPNTTTNGAPTTLQEQPEAGPSLSTDEKPSTSTAIAAEDSSSAPKSTFSFGSLSSPAVTSKPAAPTSITINPLKRPAPVNVFKQSKSAKPDRDTDAISSMGGKKGYISEAERLMKEDQARRMRTQNQGYSGAGPRREGNGGRRFVLQ